MKTKRILGLFLALFVLFGICSVPVSADGITVLLDGEPLDFDVEPQLIDDRTMVPMRKIFESMGATVNWDGTTRTVTAVKEDTTVIMQIDNTVITVNGTEIILDVPPKIVDERTLVPARAVAESFDAFVDWDGATKTVIIKTVKEDDLYGAASPVLDFSQDDGTMSRLHCQLRLTFEQSYLPEMIFTNQEELKKVIVESPQDFLGYIDDAVWGPCMNSVIVDYMINSEEEYVINTEEDITKYIREIADQYSLHAHQSYVADAILLSEGKYCVLLSMADIHAQLKVPEMEKMFIAPYIAIVYDETADQFRYFILEKSFEDYYALCTYKEDGTHGNYGMIENDKKVFVENVKRIVDQE